MTAWDAHYDAIYSVQGVTAAITIGANDPVSVTLVHRTEMITPETYGVTVPTVKPGYCIRTSEMAEKGISRDDLLGATFEIRSVTWRIENTEPRPGPEGPGTGEYFLLIESA